MNMEAFKEDLYFLYTALLKHPTVLIDAQAKRNLMQLYEAKTGEVYSYDSFIDAATELTSFFRDGHTNIEIPYSEQDLCIPLSCGWDKNGSLVLDGEGYGEIPVGAQIAEVDGVAVEELVSLMSNRIPHENRYLVKSRMICYPYQNYHLFSKMNLNRLFGVKDSYDVSFLLGGGEVTKRCYLEYYNGFLEFKDEDDFISYEIQDEEMTLHLDACIFNEQYKKTLEMLAWLCKERKITTFVLDLSRNMGGNSAVIDEFISYTDTETFRRYEMIDYSAGEARQISSRRTLVRNERKPVCFPADMYCKVPCHTFSSARTFAVTLKDNGIARIIGTATGGKPNSYGMPKKLRMPKSGLRFRVSTSYFMRPDERKDDAITLEADK